MSAANKFLALPAGKQVMAIHIWCLLGWTRVVQCLVPFSKIVTRLQQNNGQPNGDDARSIAHLVAQVANHTPWESNCLTRSICCGHLLKSRDIAFSFHLGTRVLSGQLEAHAWLSADGQILDDKNFVASYDEIHEFNNSMLKRVTR